MKPVLDPSSVAILGASDNPDKIGGRPLRFLRDFGYRGRVYPINPGRETVQGVTAYTRLEDLPEVPEAVIVAVAGKGVAEAVDRCAALGVRMAVIMASGFGETGPEGKAVERAMRQRANAAGMRLVGPNSQGLANFGTGAVLSFSTMFLESPPQDGPVAIISQSGAMSVVPYGLLREKGIGIRHVHSTGNDGDVTVSELALEVLDDAEVRLILLYLENLTDPEVLALAADKARERGVPIIALKSGQSESGQRAASSHTGAIATSDRVVEAFFRKYGIWRARDTLELVQAAELYLYGWKPSGRRLAVVSNSGATCVLAADAAEREGLAMAQFSGNTEGRLRSALPEFASARNPIDITAALLTNSGLFGEVLPIGGSDPEVDLFLIGLPVSGRGYDYHRFARDTGDFLCSSDKPTVVAAAQEEIRKVFRSEGVPAFATEGEAVAALAQFVNHRQLLLQAATAPLANRRISPQPRLRALDEDMSLASLGEHGVQTARRVICHHCDAAVAFLDGVNEGMVLKACSAEFPHKSEHGLVHVGLRDADSVAAAYEDICGRLCKLGRADIPLLAAEMVRGQREMLVGGHIDPWFGPVVVIGDGGLAVEAMPDNVLLLPPFTDDDVTLAVNRLRIAPLFHGVRRRPPLNAGAVAGVAQAVAALLMDAQGGIASVDVNPVMVSPTGACAVDALIEVVEEEAADALPVGRLEDD